MQDNKELQDFDLDDILNEFHDTPQEEPGPLDITGELTSLLGDWEEIAAASPVEKAKASTSMETSRMTDLITQLEQEMDAQETSDEEPDAEKELPMDTLRMNEIIAEISKMEPDAPTDEPTLRVDIPEEDLSEAPEVTDDPTIRMELSEELLADLNITDEPTIRVEPSDEDLTGPEVTDEPTIGIDMPELEAEVAQEAAKIIYNPRTRLRELKKKLVAGPEKRYYELSEIGVGRLQIAIILNLVLVGLCAAVTTMYSLNMIPENRLRFMVFSQILAMLLSALLGCNQMMDGIGDLFKGKFTINTLLTFTFAACCVDAVFCLSELRIPCCAAFSLEITMALWARYQRITTEMSQMDTMRKAVRLHALVKFPDYFEGRSGILRRDGEVEDFMDTYKTVSGPERVQNIYAFLSLLLSIGIAVLAGMNHGTSMALQILSTSLLVAVPASFFVALTRPASLLQRRLHMVGTVLCGWKGVKNLCGKASFPLRDEDLFPAGTTKLNGVKYYGDRSPDEILSYAASLIAAAGGSLVNVFRQMLSDRDGVEHSVANFRSYGNGGVGGEICGEPVLMGSLDFLQDLGVDIPQGTMVAQAVYVAIDGQLSAVFAISYAKMRSASAGLISLCGTRKIQPVLVGSDFMLTGSLLRAKFGVNTRRIAFPAQEVREALDQIQPEDDAPAMALATRDDLASYAYAVSGARALRSASRLGVVIHLLGGILGLLIMAAVAILGDTSLLTPTHILLYQLVWMVPGLLITEWARTA